MNKNTKLKSTKDRRKELMSEPDLEYEKSSKHPQNLKKG